MNTLQNKKKKTCKRGSIGSRRSPDFTVLYFGQSSDRRNYDCVQSSVVFIKSTVNSPNLALAAGK